MSTNEESPSHSESSQKNPGWLPTLEDTPKPFLEHLEELRWTLIKSLIALLGAMIPCWIFSKYIMALIQHPLNIACADRGLDPTEVLIFIKVMGPFSITILTGFFAGIIIACPFILFFLGQFLLPALHDNERKLLLPTFIAGAILFVTGVLFSYFVVLPGAVGFFLDFAAYYDTAPRWDFAEYVSFVLMLLVAFGISFEMPLVIVILAKLGLVDADFLKKNRRYVAFGLVVFTACITPTSDPFTFSMLFGPLYVLFEASIIITAMIDKKRLEEEL